MVSVIMSSFVKLKSDRTKCHYVKCCYVEFHLYQCHYAECFYDECYCTECHYAEFCYAECH